MSTLQCPPSGLGLELSPHYSKQALVYIQANPSTGVASPGPQQGFNSGVALYHLGRMRASPQYKREVEVARMRELTHDKYRMAGTLGDQVGEVSALCNQLPYSCPIIPCCEHLFWIGKLASAETTVSDCVQ